MWKDNRITHAEAAAILGCSLSTVQQYVDDGRLPPVVPREYRGLERSDVEDLAAREYAWLRHRNDPEPYWVAGQRAAQTLGVTREGLAALTSTHRLAYVCHRDGTPLYRREQLAGMRRERESRVWS